MHDLLQGHALPTAAARGLAAAAHVAGLAANDQAVRWARQLDLIDRITAQAGQGLTGIAQEHFNTCTATRQQHRLVAVVNAQLEFVGLHPRLVTGAQQQQPVVDHRGNVSAVRDDAKSGFHAWGSRKAKPRTGRGFLVMRNAGSIPQLHQRFGRRGQVRQVEHQTSAVWLRLPGQVGVGIEHRLYRAVEVPVMVLTDHIEQIPVRCSAGRRHSSQTPG
ncbi:hypothetical protein D3C77_465150 [compost metagenome]